MQPAPLYCPPIEAENRDFTDTKISIILTAQYNLILQLHVRQNHPNHTTFDSGAGTNLKVGEHLSGAKVGGGDTDTAQSAGPSTFFGYKRFW